MPSCPSLRAWRLVTIFLAVLSNPVTATPQEMGSFEPWTDAQKEEFLEQAKIVRTETLDAGVTLSSRAELEHAGVQHDAQIQSIDVSKPSYATPRGVELNFKDSYRFNIAAYRLNRLLGLGMVPVSVYRLVKGKPSALTWWVDDVQMTEKTRFLKRVSPPTASIGTSRCTA